jgi:hypothetical protein
MWDDAVLDAKRSGKPVLVFDLDLIDSNSIKLAQEVIEAKGLQAFIGKTFEPAMNDFAVDPPMAVGLDSLRNLGWRLSGLEKDYGIAMRPCMILLRPDREEIDRIAFPQNLSSEQLQSRMLEILAGKGTLQATIDTFWKDTTSIDRREKLIQMFAERSKYDSVVKHLDVLRHDVNHPEAARSAWIRYADLKLEMEGSMEPLNALFASISKHGMDSILGYQILQKKLEYFTARKKTDSVATAYERIMSYICKRDPDLLNEFAWNMATYSKDVKRALALINEAIKKDSTNPNFYDTRAVIEGRMKRLDAAIRDEQQALKYANADDQKYFQDQLHQFRRQQADANSSSKSK